MDEQASAPVARRLPIWTVAARSYGYVWEHRRAFAPPILIVFLVWFIWQTLWAWLLPDVFANPGRGKATETLGPLILEIPCDFLQMAFMVGVHRTVLLGEFRYGAEFLRCDRYLLDTCSPR